MSTSAVNGQSNHNVKASAVKAHSAKPKNQPQEYRGDLSLIALYNEPPKVKKQSTHGGQDNSGYGHSLDVRF